MPSMASITQRQGSERRVIYFILKNKSTLPLSSIVEWGQARSKDNISGSPWFFKAKETFASSPLLEFDIWPLDVVFQLGKDMAEINSLLHPLSAISGATSCHHISGQWIKVTRKASIPQKSGVPAPQKGHPHGKELCHPTGRHQRRLEDSPWTQTSYLSLSGHIVGWFKIQCKKAEDYICLSFPIDFSFSHLTIISTSSFYSQGTQDQLKAHRP